MGAPTSEGQRKPNETEIQGVTCKDEDEENHESAKIALSDVLQKSTNEALEIDSKLTEGNQPTTTTTELDSKEAEAGQFDEAKKDDEEEAYQQKTAEPEKLPQEERNDKIGANSKHLPDQQVEEATAKSTKEMEQKLDAGYQHKKMQNAHKTTILTEEVSWVKSKTLCIIYH